MVEELSHKLLNDKKTEVFSFLKTLPAEKSSRIKDRLLNSLKTQHAKRLSRRSSSSSSTSEVQRRDSTTETKDSKKKEKVKEETEERTKRTEKPKKDPESEKIHVEPPKPKERSGSLSSKTKLICNGRFVRRKQETT